MSELEERAASAGESGGRRGRRATRVEMTAAQREVRLQVTGLEVRLGQSGPDVVRDVSFAVPAGEVLGLVGESGSGKTTVALALLGHTRRGLRITAGQVLLDGTDLLALSPRDLQAARGAQVSYVPQDPSSALNPTLRVGTQVREVLQVHAGAVGDAGDRVPRSCGRHASTPRRRCCTGTRISSPEASSSGSCWPWRLPAGHR